MKFLSIRKILPGYSLSMVLTQLVNSIKNQIHLAHFEVSAGRPFSVNVQPMQGLNFYKNYDLKIQRI